MNTAFLLMAQYNAMAVIPLDQVVKDYFPHLGTQKFLRKIATGEIRLPLTRIEPNSQKGAKGVHLTDLATYIDAQRAAGVKESKQLNGERVQQ
ncbi:pyocin activator PrtN family protein [Comamonas piscis]|jgi:hypothetical protein|uniref:Pyocin activator PrtN family protein n=2 Tax=Comamonas TaxID=283 RepID=A0A7G5EIB9_9BURK|nr:MULTISPECIES: pyocin activator PrtN family protein [Comamonas]MDR2331630.1 pyocin activator PrtN family protein [Comamonas sp.]QMV73744.1 pyocin activator PrtN family protein [Comamonas piscis]WSO32168.1 pyocin activator PrtN family protein [Comamonas piscis]